MIALQDDAPALPSNILNDIVDECKDAMDLIEPSWLVNNLTNDSFDCDENNQNDSSDIYTIQDDIDNLQNGANLIHQGILQNSADILQNSVGILQNSAGILQNSADLLQSGGILNGGSNFVLNGLHVLQNGGMLQQWPSLVIKGSNAIQGGSDIQNIARMLQNEPGILQNGAIVIQNPPNNLQYGSNMYLDGSGTLQNTNLVQYGAGNVNIVSNVPKCIECQTNGSECKLHGIRNRVLFKTQQDSTSKQKNQINKSNILKQYGSQKKHVIHGKPLTFNGLPRNLNQLRRQQLVLKDGLQSHQYGLQGQQPCFQGQQSALQGQHHLQGKQIDSQGHQHGLKGQYQDMLGLKVHPDSPICPANTKVYRNKKIKASGPECTYTKPIHYDELIQPGIYKCTRCCKIYSNR